MANTHYIHPKEGTKPLSKKLYSSWSDSGYSPKGVFNTPLTAEDIELKKGFLSDIWAGKEIKKDTSKKFIDVTYKMKNNRFYDLKVWFDDFSLAEDITTYDLYKSLWSQSVFEYDYNINNIIPFTNEMVGEFIDEFPKHKDTIKNLILATRFVQYKSYLPSSEWALYLIGSPEMFQDKQSWVLDREFKDPKDYHKIATRISRIPDDILEGRTQGKSYGKLTKMAQDILKDILKVEKLESVLAISYGSQ
ncbi:MAG: hypothetical protein H8E55_22870 [Pelagibacterales bacterium]|nr:hypothetical protein [Pelagibacterales bacterium]